MHKFDTSQYYKLWESLDGRQIMTKILEDPTLLYSNHTFWREKFLVDPDITPTDSTGAAVYKATMSKKEGGTMAHMRAPLGGTVTKDHGNLEFYTGTIPSFITDGHMETAPTRQYKEKLYEQLGADGDANLVLGWINDVLTPQIDAMNQTISNMSAQLMSTGKINYTYGEGIQSRVAKADIPTENFLKAGTKVWTDTTARLLDQIRNIVTTVNEMKGVSMQWQLEITRNMWNNNFLKNAQVIEWVRYFKSMNNTLLPENLSITTMMANDAIAQFEGLPKIVIIEESQKDSIQGVIHGWNDSVAVLRPVGYAGYIRHTNVADESLYSKYANDNVKFNFASANGGLGVVMNSVIPNGNMKEWHTETMMACVPTLDEFLYHFIIDTSTANS